MNPMPLLLAALCCLPLEAAETVRLQIKVNDGKGKMVPCRVHLADDKGKAQQVKGLPFFRDHFTCKGRVTLNLQPG
ncbi:MAG: hypothetical protein VCA36_06690, partial [Opitutales bacterium]